jgi:aspartate--ammonia ligase
MPLEGVKTMSDKKKDLAGPGIGDYNELRKLLPKDYNSILSKKETQIAIFEIKKYIEENLGKKLNLIRVECPLIVDKDSGMNDYLDRDGSRTPVEFLCGLGLERQIQTQVVQAVTKWKRMALEQFKMNIGDGLYTDMRAIRKDYFLDHDHSSYVDQWDWEKVIAPDDRNLDYLKETVLKLWDVFKGAEKYVQKIFPKFKTNKYPNLPDNIRFIHAEDLLDMYPDLPRKQRETEILKKHSAVFIIGIGWPLKDGYPHEMRAADYDDWITETNLKNNHIMHGLNGDILVWNPVTNRRHELTSMGIRVTKESLKKQLEMSGQLDFLNMPYHKAILNDKIPLSIGGGIGQSRTYMLLLKKAHLGECSVTVWPQKLKKICNEKNIFVLE